GLPGMLYPHEGKGIRAFTRDVKKLFAGGPTAFSYCWYMMTTSDRTGLPGFERLATLGARRPKSAHSSASLPPYGDFNDLVTGIYLNVKIDQSRATGRHRCTVGAWLGQSTHRNTFHGAVRHARDEQDLGDRHGPARGIQEADGVGIAPTPRYRRAHELRAVCAAQRPRGSRCRRLRRWIGGDLLGRCRDTCRWGGGG